VREASRRRLPGILPSSGLSSGFSAASFSTSRIVPQAWL
jgi:hypothetical protein